MLRPLGRPCKRAPQAELGRGTGEAWRLSSTLARSPPPGARTQPPSRLCRSPWPSHGLPAAPEGPVALLPVADGSPQEGGGSRRGTQAQKRARQLHPEEPTPLTQASPCVSNSARAQDTLLGSRGSGGETSPSHLPSPCPPRAPDPELCPFTFRGGGPCRQVLNFLQALQLLGVASAMHRGEGHQAHL